MSDSKQDLKSRSTSDVKATDELMPDVERRRIIKKLVGAAVIVPTAALLLEGSINVSAAS